MQAESDHHPLKKPIEPQEPPPFLWQWKWVYGAVVIYTLLIVVVLYWITVTLNY